MSDRERRESQTMARLKIHHSLFSALSLWMMMTMMTAILDKHTQVNAFVGFQETITTKKMKLSRFFVGTKDDSYYYPQPKKVATTSLFVKPTKWDNIIDDEEDEEGYEFVEIPPDMTYVERNIKRAHENFLAIRKAGGKLLTNDVYVRDPNTDVFWYSGKVAKVSDVSIEDCISRQWPMIERHAMNLRPLELYPIRGRLEIWVAPGDSELEVAYNRPTLQMKKMIRPKDFFEYKRRIHNKLVGFQGEMYQEYNEEGFRTWRTEDGLPARPEINPGGGTRPPTDEEYDELMKKLRGKDVNKVYEEQERRKKEGTL